MPTKRPRHTLTETDQIRDALAVARRRWPGERNPGRLLVRLIMTGRETLDQASGQELRRRRDAVAQTAGVLAGCYEAGERERLRDEWPD